MKKIGKFAQIIFIILIILLIMAGHVVGFITFYVRTSTDLMIWLCVLGGIAFIFYWKHPKTVATDKIYDTEDIDDDEHF